MRIQILWADPRERRFGSGDILDAAQLADLGLDAQQLLDAKEAQLLDPLDHDGNGKRGGSKPRKAKEA